MPREQWPADAFPAFASGCCFVLSADLVLDVFVSRAGLRPPSPRALRFIRVFDVPVGVALAEHAGVVRVHAERIRPYRPLPLFQPDSIAQHYMRPEEFRPFCERAYTCGAAPAGRDARAARACEPLAGGSSAQGGARADDGEADDVAGGVYRALVAAGVLRR